MQVSFLLLFIFLAILGVSLTCSSNHLLKSFVSLGITCFILGIYIYLQRAFPNLTSFKAMSAYFYFLLKDRLASRGLSQFQMSIVSETIYAAILFIIVYVISFLILTAFALGGNPKQGRRDRMKRVVFGFLYFVSWSLIAAFFLAEAAPVFSFSLGFLSDYLKFFQGKLV
jgi:hypothetical protein